MKRLPRSTARGHGSRAAESGSPHSSARCGATLALLLAALATSCARPPAAPPVSAVQDSTVTYTLDWTRDDVAPAVGATGFVVTSDLGYTVHVERGWVTSYGVELVECPRAAAPSTLSRAGALLWSAIEGTAWAGHSTDAPNPAAAHPVQVESLIDVDTHDVATLALAPQAYCKLHYLLARATAEARGLPPAPDMVGASLRVEGRHRAPGATAEVPFTLQTASAYGVLVEHVGRDALPLRVDTGDGATRVTIRRRRARMFDGIDFARTTERVAALQVLRALVEHVDVRIEPVADERTP